MAIWVILSLKLILMILKLIINIIIIIDIHVLSNDNIHSMAILSIHIALKIRVPHQNFVKSADAENEFNLCVFLAYHGHRLDILIFLSVVCVECTSDS